VICQWIQYIQPQDGEGASVGEHMLRDTDRDRGNRARCTSGRHSSGASGRSRTRIQDCDPEPSGGDSHPPKSVLGSQREACRDLALRYRVPVTAQDPGLVEAGGLIQYGVDFPDLCRRAATFLDKILKGAKPGDLPVQQPEKFDLIINLKTAKALGLTIPPSLLQRADHVIE
jgi:hypothetical protein